MAKTKGNGKAKKTDKAASAKLLKSARGGAGIKRPTIKK
jgi:hypothetical protein